MTRAGMTLAFPGSADALPSVFSGVPENAARFIADCARLSRRSSEPDERPSRDAARVIKAATDLSGDVHRASSWYKDEPLPAFASKTAEQFVHEGRTEDALQYLVSLEAGATG